MPEAASLPIIDVSAEGPDNQAKVAKALVDAAAEYGFVYIKNSGLDLTHEQIENAFAMVGDFKEGFNFGAFNASGKATQSIPSSMELHQVELAAFREACHSVCRKLLLLFGIGLEVSPPDFFAKAHATAPEKPSGSILRFLYYPPPSATPDAQDDDVRAGAHSDYGSVTLLFRLPGQAGLEILTPSGAWAPVPVSPAASSGEGEDDDEAPPPILVNIGDLLSYWTNGLLRSTVHRVAFPAAGGDTIRGEKGKESAADPRYSIVYFCHPADDTPLAAVPSERVRSFSSEKKNDLAGAAPAAGAGGANSQSQQGKVLTAKEHLQSRLRATYLQMYSGEKEGGEEST
ncbi:hypothetical protein SLS62_000740 [Diatrype stigma]|uniref:Fe2OG dioxygenase domain-containing protein n=1 Tax=Diatrype stigma TaxID=117547 RepID=A0AAN9YU84_9PEZI